MAGNPQGLGLRVDNALKYVLNDAAWTLPRERDQLFDLALDPTERLDRAAERDETTSLRNLARQALLEGWKGLRLRFENEGGQPFRGTLLGASITERRVRSFDAPAGALRFEKRGVAHFRVAAGSAFTLSVEDVHGEELEIRVRRVGEGGTPGPPFSVTFPIAELGSAQAVRWNGERWLVGSPDDPGPRLGLAVWLQQGAEGPDEDPARLDPLLHEQLQALGYID